MGICIMADEHSRLMVSYLSAIRSAIAALALAVLAFLFVFGGDDGIGLFLALGSVVLIIYSFVPPSGDASDGH